MLIEPSRNPVCANMYPLDVFLLSIKYKKNIISLSENIYLMFTWQEQYLMRAGKQGGDVFDSHVFL